jgi:hypothetical protein
MTVITRSNEPMRKQILSVVAAVALMTTASFAQRGGGPVGMAAGLQQAYNIIKGNLTQAAEAMPESGWNAKPSTLEDKRTYGQVIGHVAAAQFGQCSGASGMANPNSANLEDPSMSRAAIIKALADSFAVCDKALGMLTDANATEMISGGRGGPTARAILLMQMVSHSNEMYGTAAVYLRSQNVVPPSTANRGRGRGGRGN